MTFFIDIVPKVYDCKCQALSLRPNQKIRGRLSNQRPANTAPIMFHDTYPMKPTKSGRFTPAIMVNGCTGKMGRAVVEAANLAGIPLIATSFGRPKDSARIVSIDGKKITIYGPSEREMVLSSLFKEFPHMVVVDYTVPDCINDNAELYCKVGVPFVMGTTGGDREKLYKTVEESKVYAVISPQMGKQVVAFLAAMEIMAEQFPGAFAGYSLEITESHQSSKVDASGTAKALVASFNKLGIEFKPSQIEKIRDPNLQVSMMGVPDEYLASHAFHLYHIVSPDNNVVFQFQHNVCGRQIYALGTIDAALFLSKKARGNAEKKIYNMVDVMREGNGRS